MERVTRTPAGPCPFPPPTVPKTMRIVAWFWQVREHFLERGEFITAGGIAYWARIEAGPMGEDVAEYASDVVLQYARAIEDQYLETEAPTETAAHSSITDDQAR